MPKSARLTLAIIFSGNCRITVFGAVGCPDADIPYPLSKQPPLFWCAETRVYNNRDIEVYIAVILKAMAVEYAVLIKNDVPPQFRGVEVKTIVPKAKRGKCVHRLYDDTDLSPPRTWVRSFDGKTNLSVHR